MGRYGVQITGLKLQPFGVPHAKLAENKKPKPSTLNPKPRLDCPSVSAETLNPKPPEQRLRVLCFAQQTNSPLNQGSRVSGFRVWWRVVPELRGS